MKKYSDSELLAEIYSSIPIENNEMAPAGTGVGQEEYYPTTDSEKAEIPNTALGEPEIDIKKEYAKILNNFISVIPSTNKSKLKLKIPNGIEDVKKLHKKILQHKGNDYKYFGWNANDKVCIFTKINY